MSSPTEGAVPAHIESPPEGAFDGSYIDLPPEGDVAVGYRDWPVEGFTYGYLDGSTYSIDDTDEEMAVLYLHHNVVRFTRWRSLATYLASLHDNGTASA